MRDRETIERVPEKRGAGGRQMMVAQATERFGLDSPGGRDRIRLEVG
jgi:hypothetical protein